MTFHRPLLLLLLLGTPAISQTTPPPVPPAPPAVASTPLAEPSAPIQGARGEAVESVPAANLGETKIVEDIVEEKLNGTGLAGLYRRYTGRRVIVTTAAAAAEISFVQEASADDPLTYAKAAELLRRAAVVEGFVFTQHPEDPNLDILTLASGGPKPTNVNVDVYNESSTLPDKDVVITYVMTLSYIKPEQAVQIFTQIIGQVGAYGSISSVPNASAVVITEKASLIKSLVELKRTIDVPGSVQATRFMEVQYADASELATVIEKLLTDQKSVQTTAGVQRAPAGDKAAAEAPSGAEGGGAGEVTPVQISADSRTNRIFAMGRPVDLVFIENLVREFDIPTSDKNFLRRKLRFLKVSEFLPVAADALTAAFTGTGDGAAAGASPTGQQSRARPASNTNTNSRNSNSNSNLNRNNNSNNSSFGGDGGSSSSDADSSLGDPEVTSAPESMLVGRTQLVADNITNSIFVQGPPSALEIVERLLAQLDVKPQQVMISTVIGQLTLGKNRELGFNYLVDGKDVRGGGGGSGFAVADATVPPGFPVFNPMSVADAGLRVYGQIGDLSGYIRALSSKNDFTVLSRPSIFTSNNQKGVISSGERIAIPTEGGTSTGSYSTGTRIQYEEVVLKLEVIPLVNSNNEITMQISLLNDEQNGTQTIEGAGTAGGDLTVPRIATRKILTTATVPNNQTIVLGGLIIGKNEKKKSGIPILSDIPLVGSLFSSNSKSEDRTELMVFIQPSVVGDDAALEAAQLDMSQRYDVSDQVLGFAEDGSSLFSTPKSTSKDSLPEEKKTPRMGGAHRR